ncbi:zinc finger protein 862-like [Dendropsophus ebraccatus]|uniref:zinc finger protein 862-like n=1 Tax=Dendropsophus ebraccatus TaxID=150705 RepID=UPI003831A9A7
MAKHKITDFFKDAHASSSQSTIIDQDNSDETLSLVSENGTSDQASNSSSATKISVHRSRHFKSVWLQEFPWLKYNKEKGVMYCEFCSKAGDVAGKTDFIKGTDHFKKETIKKHGDSLKHKNARDCIIARSAPKQTPLARAVAHACEKTAEKDFKEMKIKFNVAYMIAREELPFTKYAAQILLMKKNGMDISKTYDNDTACAEIIGCIAEEFKAQTLNEAAKATYISIITDCGTDVSGSDNVIVYCRYILSGVPVNRLVGLGALQHSHARGILESIGDIFSADHSDPYWWHHKLSAFGADGASVNMGASGGIGALMRKEIGEHILSFHCLPHRLELAMLNTQKCLPMVQKVYDLLHLVWKTYHFSPKSKRELRVIGAELGCKIRCPSAVKTQRWLPHIFRALSVFLSFDQETGQGQYTAVHHHMEHLSVSSKNSDISGRAKHIVQQMENLMFVAFCHFLHDLFGEISKLSLTLQKNSLILPQAVAAIKTCIMTVNNFKEVPLRNGKLQEFYKKINVEEMQTGTQRASHMAKRRKTSHTRCIAFQNIQLKDFDAQEEFMENLNDHIRRTVEVTVGELERRFEVMLSSEKEGRTSCPDIIQCFSVFCHDSWPDDLVTYGEEEIDTLTKWYKTILLKNGCEVEAIQAEWRQLKFLVKGQFADLSYSSLWETVISKEPYCTDFGNVLHLIHIMLILPISAAQCERGFSAQNRIKSQVRSSLHISTLEDLIRISSEGPSLELFNPEPSVKRWFNSKRKRRPQYKGWPGGTYILGVSDTDSEPDL